MLKKTIAYEDFDGNPVTEDHYFHLSKAELVELQMGHNDTYEKDGETLTGYRAKLQRIIDAEDGASIMREFKDLILNSYGQKSMDGRRFNKSPLLREEFATSEAYSTLFVELCTDADAAAMFVSGIIPRGMAEDVAKIQERERTSPLEPKNVFTEAEKAEAERPEPETPRVLTMEEAQAMPANELHNLLARGKAVLASGEG